MSAESLLQGLKVVEIGQYIAAPFAATIFADQGAEVLKIERPGGDPYRQDPARFAAWNRGKTSVVLDLTTPDGCAEARERISDADVVIDNLRPGAMARLGLAHDALGALSSRLVTCSITAYGSGGPAHDEPGWEPLVHARAGAQQGVFTADQPIWLPFPMASIAAGLLAVLGIGAALVKRETTGYGQHVETSLFEGMLFLNAGPIFHRERHRPRVNRPARTPILHVYETRDGRGVQVNLSGTAPWHALCRLLQRDDTGLDFSDPTSLMKLADRAWVEQMVEELTGCFRSRTADEWETALLATPAAAAKCNTLEEWLAHEQLEANELLATVDDPERGSVRLVGPPIRVQPDPEGRTSRRRHGSEGGALGGHRVIDLSSYWAGPLAARLLAELGADVIKVEPPGGEGSYQLVPVLPNIYVDGNRSKRALTLDLREDEDRARLLELVRAADVVVENAVPGTWERLALAEADVRSVNPSLVYARAKGFGLAGPLVSRSSFDYVVQAATGMEMTQGGGRPQPTNFTANDYCTSLYLAAGAVLALLARARGAAGATVEASLMMSATVFQSEHVAQLALDGARGDAVGADLLGLTAWCRLYQAADGWLVVCAVTEKQQAALLSAIGVADLTADAVAARIAPLDVEVTLTLLAAHGVPAAVSVHPSAVPDDEHVQALGLLTTVRHSRIGRVVQVGIPLHLSVDAPAIKGPAPAPASARRSERGRETAIT